ncbi:hypothetical protein OsJ_09632 [Oryza sativa Japonica Group]|uniref:Uncharacterized protein n=1 Tax=Oryza sativa subsp. japonica TaxID=39947 RepID=B9FBM8_ORYSJ|nr:hypothetical protein OsJ_09632 [Oryza sativa Japonica Group]
MGTLITTSLCSFRSKSTAPRTPGMPQSFSSTTLSASIGVASGCNIGRGKGGCSSSKGVKDDELLVEDMEMAGEGELFFLNGVRVVGRASSSARQRPPWTCTSPLQRHGSTTMQALPYHTRTPLTNSRSSLSCRRRRLRLLGRRRHDNKQVRTVARWDLPPRGRGVFVLSISPLRREISVSTEAPSSPEPSPQRHRHRAASPRLRLRPFEVCGFRVVPTEDGGLGFVFMSDLGSQFWRRNNGWDDEHKNS